MMTGITSKALRELQGAIDGRVERKSPKAAQTVTGTVTGAKAGALRVLVDGAAESTPVDASACDVSVGDAVTCVISDGSMSITSNTTAPATSQKAVNATVAPIVEMAATASDNAASASKLATTAAAEAAEISETLGQHFWSDDGGAHVTDVPMEEWQTAEAADFPDASDTKQYSNILLNSLGMLIRAAKKTMVSVSRSAISFFDGSGSDAANVVASFGADGAQIGRVGESHIEQDYHSFKMVSPEHVTYVHFSDLRNRDGYYDYTVNYANAVGAKDSDSATGFSIACGTTHFSIADTFVEATLDGSKVDSVRDDREVVYIPVPDSTSTHSATVTWRTYSAKARAYTLDERKGNIGPFSLAFGNKTEASGFGSIAIGAGASASLEETTALGRFAEASMDYAAALGCSAEASGDSSVALGGYSVASANYAIAVGGCATAEGKNSVAIGGNASATGASSVAVGDVSSATGKNSAAVGNHATATGDGSFALGDSATATGGDMSIKAASNINLQSPVKAEGALDVAGAATLNGGLSATGDMTYITLPSIDRDGTVESAVWPGIYMRDKDAQNVAHFGVTQNDAGYVGAEMYGYGSTNASNYLQLLMNGNTPKVSINQPGAWLDALYGGMEQLTQVSDIIAPGSAVNVNQAVLVKWGRVRNLWIYWTPKSKITVPATGDISNVTIGTLTEGNRPVVACAGQTDNSGIGPGWYTCNYQGVLTLDCLNGTGSSRTIAAGTYAVVLMTYLA